MWQDVVTLIETRVDASGGTPRRTPVGRRDVFANVRSTGFTEFYTAKSAGYAGELKVDIFACEYAGETMLEFCGRKYTIARTRRNPKNIDHLELTLTDLKVGEQ